MRWCCTLHLGRRKIDLDALDPIFRQEIACKLLDLTAVDDGADQLGVKRFAPVGTLRRRGQAEPIGGDGAEGGDLVARTGEVMALVEHDESETISPAFQVDVGRVVGGDGQGLDIVVAAADQTHGRAERCKHFSVPLVHERNGRRDDECGPADVSDREKRDQCLAGPGRQDDHAPASLIPPGLQGLALMWKRRARGAQLAFERLKMAGVVRVRELVAAQRFDDGAIMARLRTKDAGSLVKPAAGESFQQGIGTAGENERAGIELDVHGFAHDFMI
jgi:hypothetical protein